MLKPVETSIWTGFVHAASWTSTTLSQNTCLCCGQPTSVMPWWSQCLLRSQKAICVLQRKLYLSWIGWECALCICYEKIKHFLDLGRGWLLRSHVSKKTYFNLTNITLIRIMTSDREAMHWLTWVWVNMAPKNAAMITVLIITPVCVPWELNMTHPHMYSSHTSLTCKGQLSSYMLCSAPVPCLRPPAPSGKGSGG